MSQENVEIVLAAQATDLVQWLKDDAVWSAGAARYHPDFEHASVNRVEGTVVHHNAEALRRGWSAWVAPWESYRQEIDEAFDCGERVLVFCTHFARAPGTDHEVELKGASLWTVRDGKILRFVSYTDRSEALEAAGLAEQDARVQARRTVVATVRDGRTVGWRLDQDPVEALEAVGLSEQDAHADS
jgi:ketosteroid isomerase-like protein